MTNWPETILMARAWFEGNPDAALAELEHRAINAQTVTSPCGDLAQRVADAGGTDAWLADPKNQPTPPAGVDGKAK